jgi:Putative abortive phage resistance protein AbiGi, antitoxin
MPKLYHHIHRHQLFHWIGGHIHDVKMNRSLTDEERQKYVGCLADTLITGLWASVPGKLDGLGDGKTIKVVRPITCFTEWSLGESLPHTKRYGRLGFGFPKSFVSKLGGQPVTYVRDDLKNNAYVTALEEILRFTKSIEVSEEAQKIKDYIEYLAHFAKKTRHESEPKAARTKEQKDADRRINPSQRESGGAKSRRKTDPLNRQYGEIAHFMEEREWRIVYDVLRKRYFRPHPHNSDRKCIPFKPGKELFTLVLPDNQTVRIAMNNKTVRKAVYPENAPHVTILSLTDIETLSH